MNATKEQSRLTSGWPDEALNEVGRLNRELGQVRRALEQRTAETDAFASDITRQEQTERYQRLSTEILGILNDAFDLPETIHHLRAVIQQATGFDAVGIRLASGEDFPYQAQQGFSDEFLLTENTLVVRDRTGGICRDQGGQPRLECTCGLVISGQADLAQPFFTPGGSFWTNNALPLLDLPPGQDPRLHPRNHCIHAGFHSVALIPVRADGKIVGLLQLNDRKPDCFTLERVRYFEGIGAGIGVALMRRQTDQALRESEARFRAMFETMTQGVVYHAADGSIISANPAAMRILGRSLDQMRGKDSMDPDWGAIHEDGSLFPGAEHPAAVALRTGEVVENVIMGVFSPQNGCRWLNIRAKPQFKPGDTTPHQVYVIFDDITERKRIEADLSQLTEQLEQRVRDRTAKLEAQIAERLAAEQALRDSETRFHLLFEYTAGGIAFSDAAGNLLDANPAFCSLIGYSPDELRHLNFRDLSLPDELPQEERYLSELVRRARSAYTLEKRFRTKSGAITWMETTVSATYAPDGQVKYFIGLMTDIGERKQAEEQLRLSEQKYRTVADFTYDWEYWRSPAGQYLFVSPSCERITGYAAQAFIDDPELLMTITHPDDRSLLSQHSDENTCDQEPSALADFRIITRSGEERWINHTCQPVFDAAGCFLGRRGSNRDITDRKAVEQALQAEREQLAQRVLERTAELQAANAELGHALRVRDEFLATMSHELRSPLNSILSLAEILGEGLYGDVTAEQRKYLKGISESGQHLLELINDILDLSKIEAGKLVPEMRTVWVPDVCQASLRLVREQALKKQVALESYLDPGVTTLEADERRLKQILVNLLSNAVKFTPAGGRVWLDVKGDAEAQTMSFVVGDTGIGIAEKDLPRLFQPFVQLDSSLARQHAGTGLGLALVQRMVGMHGGSTHVQSEPGRGSLFNVRLPWSGNQAPASATVETPEVPIQTNRVPSVDRGLILLVDDSELVIETVSHYLKAKGYALGLARNGLEAIERARALRPALILMDVQMPHMDGLEATRQIRTETGLPGVPIIAVSALAMPGDRERCLAAGVTDYLSKPVSLKQIAATLEKYAPQPLC